MRTIFLLLLRFAAAMSFVVWVGGFTFYGGVVVPVMDADIGRFETGEVSRKVTATLNLVGTISLTLWWVLIVVERRCHSTKFQWARLGALLLSSFVQMILLFMHRAMIHHIDTMGLSGFSRLHERYLTACTVQWVANLVLLLSTTAIWTSLTTSEAGGIIGKSRDLHHGISSPP